VVAGLLERGSRLHHFLILFVKFCCYSCSCWDCHGDCGGLFDSCFVLAIAALGSFSNCVRVTKELLTSNVATVSCLLDVKSILNVSWKKQFKLYDMIL
jgi:hypothetical protein